MIKNFSIFSLVTVLVLFNIFAGVGTKKANRLRVSDEKCQKIKEVVKQHNPKCIVGMPLIVGGSKTEAGEFPHMAAIGWEEEGSHPKFNCGGSLISNKFVLTAAHCSHSNGESPTLVRLGDQNLIKSDDGAQPRDYKISSFTKHPNYTFAGYKNDIALIELSQTVSFNRFIRPICLHQASKYDGKVVATGWGQKGESKLLSPELMKVEILTKTNKICTDRLRNERITVLPTNICAGGIRGKDTCNGDSGGPIQISHSDQKCVYTIIGITSHGLKRCGGTTKPSVYTRISSYLDWIEENVWAEDYEKWKLENEID